MEYNDFNGNDYETQQGYSNNIDSAASAEAGQSLLTKGILAVVFACTISIVGIILGVQGRNMAKSYIQTYGTPYGKAKVGSILSSVGFGLGIGVTIFWVVYIAIVVAVIFGIFGAAAVATSGH